LTGGIASIYYGEPRLTQDIDIVIDNAQVAAALDSFLQSIEESDFIYESDSVRNAVAEQGMFQLLDAVESLKLDIYPLKCTDPCPSRFRLPASPLAKTCLDTFHEIATIRRDKAMDSDVDPTMEARPARRPAVSKPAGRWWRAWHEDPT
jgi:hypothetical protein